MQSGKVQLYGFIRRMKRLLDFTTNEGAAKFYTDTMLDAESATHYISKSTEREIDEEGYYTPRKRATPNKADSPEEYKKISP